jgi:hypothetical protein
MAATGCLASLVLDPLQVTDSLVPDASITRRTIPSILAQRAVQNRREFVGYLRPLR